MKIKKFYGFTLKDATSRMKDELGADSVILSTRVVEDEAKYGDRKVFEVTAGIEEEEILVEENTTNEKIKKENFSNELKKLTEKIYKQKSNIHPSQENKSGIEKPQIAKNNLSSEYIEIEEMLLHREIDSPLAKSIVAELRKNNGFSSSDLDNQLFTTISSMIPTDEFTIQKGVKQKIISFVGPTGVGKTTCVAKLALISKIIHKLEIGLITMDTYRLGALDQLKIFSEISNIELEVAYEPKDIPQFIKKFKKKDLIFIDTVGRSQNSTELLNDIKKFLSTVKTDETYLVLNSTSSTRTLMDIANKFKLFNYNGLIFTKLDEAVSFGNILNLTNRIEIPIKFLTNGQTIPDDIIAADSDFIANLIISGKLNR